MRDLIARIKIRCPNLLRGLWWRQNGGKYVAQANQLQVLRINRPESYDEGMNGLVETVVHRYEKLGYVCEELEGP